VIDATSLRTGTSFDHQNPLFIFQGVVTFAAGKHEQALGYFVKAVQTNPVASGATVRTALALCCFKLEQYDRARLALEKSLSIDVRLPFALWSTHNGL
jgi:Tfp pilus assembly protein PilF